MPNTNLPTRDDPQRVLPGEDAVYLGWQDTYHGELFPLYTVVKADHPLLHSTVSDTTLRKMHLQVPRTPSPYPDPGTTPWHDLGTELDHPSTAREAIEAAGLNFTVAKKALSTYGPLLSQFHDSAIVRTDTGHILGIIDEAHEPIQNRDAFTFFDTLIREDEAIYETAGVLGRGEHVWLLAKLPGYLRVHGNDIVSKYLMLTNCHDGSSTVRVKISPIRLVCNNTLTSALQGTGEFLIHHTDNEEKNIAQARELLHMAHSVFEQLEVTFNRMALKTITERELLDYVRALVPDNEEAEDTARTSDIRNAVLTVHESGRGSDLARGTLWGAFNSVTEYTDHLMVDVDPAKRLESIWFGYGEQLKLKAFHLAESMTL
jgi:phage/plasmid-like protein (TIGR03299 family)